ADQDRAASYSTFSYQHRDRRVDMALLQPQKLLPPSTARSLPTASWLAEPEKLWSPWKLEGQELVDAKQDALRLSLHEQQQAGIDIVSDGEQTRQHFVTTFIEHLEGVDFNQRETVKIRDRYEASVPSVVGE